MQTVCSLPNLPTPGPKWGFFQGHSSDRILQWVLHYKRRFLFAPLTILISNQCGFMNSCFVQWIVIYHHYLYLMYKLSSRCFLYPFAMSP